jgi:protein O-mannosyl-transferase
VAAEEGGTAHAAADGRPRPIALARRHAPLFLALAATLAVYGQTVTFPFVNWDDPTHVYRNRAVVDPQTLSAVDRWLPRHLGYPMPVTILSYRVDRALYGPTSLKTPDLAQGRGYHATNVALLMATVALVYALCLGLVGAPWAAAGGAALFGLHPAAVETVAWVAGRKELLAALFATAALLAWSRFLRRGGAGWLVFVGLGAAAIASKPSALFLVPAAAWLWLREASRGAARSASPRRWPCALGGIVLLATGGIVVFHVSLEWQRAVGATAAAPLGEVLRRALFALGFHLRILLAPIDLRAKYLVDPPAGVALEDALAALFLLGVVLLVARRRWRDSAAAAGGVLALLAYLPSSSLVPLTRYLSDTYLFAPLIGVAVIAASALAAVPRGSRWRAVATTAAVGVLLTLGVASFSQARVWSSSERLWQRTMRYHPDNPIVCRMLGEGQIESGRPASAIATYTNCVKRFGVAPFANNLGVAHFLLGEHDRAAIYFRWILARRPEDPRALKYLRLIERARR